MEVYGAESRKSLRGTDVLLPFDFATSDDDIIELVNPLHRHCLSDRDSRPEVQVGDSKNVSWVRFHIRPYPRSHLTLSLRSGMPFVYASCSGLIGILDADSSRERSEMFLQYAGTQSAPRQEFFHQPYLLEAELSC